MKKLMKIAAFTTACAMLISGCSAPTQSTDNSAVLDATDAVKTYSGTTEIEFTAVSEGTEISMGTKGDIDIQDEPFFADIDLNIHSEGDDELQNTSSRLLLQDKDGEKTVYLYHEGEWNQEKVEADDFRVAASQYDVLETAKLIMEASANIQKFGTEEYNGVTADKYEGTVSVGLLPDLLEETGTLALVGTNIGARYYKYCEDMSVVMWVDSNGVILGYEIDLTDIVQNLFKALYEENNITDESAMIKFESYTAKGTVSDYNNKIDTEIPEEALNAPLVEADSETSAE